MTPSRSTTTPLVTGPRRFGLQYRYQALIVVCTIVFLETVDFSLINVALPTLAQEFDAGLSSILWLPLSSILVSTGLMLTMGRLGDLYGRKAIFSGGILFFTLGLILSAVAGSLTELIIARVIQAVGIAMSLSNLFAIITAAFPPSSRGHALGFQGLTVGAGLAAGPILGGVMLDILNWRALFWSRLPLSLLAAALALWLLRDPPSQPRSRGLDLPGAAVLFGLLFSLVLAVNRGDDWGWSSAAVLSSLTVGAVLLVAFLLIERRSASPVIALGLFRLRRFAAGTSVAVLTFGGTAMIAVLMPFYLIDALGFSTLKTGAVMAAMTLAMLVASPVAGRLSDRMGPRLLTTVGLATAVVGMLLLTSLATDSSLLTIIGWLIVVGLGIGLWQTPNNSSIMGSVPTERLGTASASVITARLIGQAIGIALGGAIFSARAASHAQARSPLGLDDPLVRPAALLDGMELAFLVGAVIAVSAALLAWFGVGGPGWLPRPFRFSGGKSAARPGPSSSEAGDTAVTPPPQGD